MTPVFPSLESAEFNEEFDSVIADVQKLVALYDEHGIRRQPSVDIETAVDSFETVLAATNALQERVRTLGAYVSAFVTTDSRNDLAQAKLSELRLGLVDLTKLGIRFIAWIGSLDVEALIQTSETAGEHAYVLRKAGREAEHQMSEAEEELFTTLSLTGGSAWGSLHGNVTSRLLATVRKSDGSEQKLPMSAVRGLAQDPDPAVRKAAFEAELKAWETVEVPLAAAMNGIKGERNTVNARRNWPDSIEPVLLQNSVDRQTLEAMQTACVESFPDFRRYLRAKARYLGKDKLAWWDIFAPLGSGTEKKWSWDEATTYVTEKFSIYSDRLSAMARRAFEERWVDAEPRDGKVDGAFCMGLRGDESRVLSNFTGSFNSVHTLAHELGHAYHNINLARRPPSLRQTPMALAETASIFCETIVTHAALGEASDDEKLPILEGDLQSNCQVVVDIHSRFLFEKRVFEDRQKRELSVKEFKSLMLECQRETYGDAIDANSLHPYMWAVKPHYYGSSYYNWPYTFGLLFGLGLFAQYRQDPEKFKAGYDDLLSSTGMEDAASLCGRFGFDIRSVDFWRSSLDIIRERIADFEKLA